MMIMYYPLLFNVKDVNGNETPYFIDDGCNMFFLKDNVFTPMHSFNRIKDGRPSVHLDLGEGKKLYLMYRLLMRACTGISDEEFRNLVVDHIDCDPSHNEYENLEIVTQSENMRRAGVKNRMPYGLDHHNAKYDDNLIRSICEDICNNVPRAEIMNRYGVNGQLVDDIHAGRSHKKISCDYIEHGFEYKTYSRDDRVLKAREICELLSSGYSVPEVCRITGYKHNFVYPIYTRLTFKDVSKDYNF